MKSLQPELFMQHRPDAIDAAIEATLTKGPRCRECGFIPVKHHADMCLTCVKKLVAGLRMMTEGRPQWKP